MKGKEKEIYTLLNETPPAGAKYTKFIKHVLEREGHWVKWKNEGCQKFMKEKEADKTMAAPPVKKRRTLYDDIMNGRKIGLGSPELTKLWGKSESNLDACKTPKRQFIPTVEEYFEEAIMHSDPKNEIEVWNSNQLTLNYIFIGFVQVLLGPVLRVALPASFGSLVATVLFPPADHDAPLACAQVLGAHFQATAQGDEEGRDRTGRGR